MSTIGFVRKKRLPPPQIPGGELDLQPPPALPRSIPTSIIPKIMPIVMMVAMGGLVAMMFTTGGMNFSNPMTLMFPMMMLMSMVTMIINNVSNSKGNNTAELNEQRKDYLRYLAGMREKITDISDQQRIALEWNNPAPQSLSNFIGSRRMWERQPSDKDFGYVRVGLGSQRLAARIIPPEVGPLEELEPVALVALRRLIKAHSVVADLPTALALRNFSKIAFVGQRETITGLLRSLILELATFHGPDHLRIAVVTKNIEQRDWSWLKWLPQAQHPLRQDSVGSARLVYSSLTELEQDWEFDFKDRGNFQANEVVVDRPFTVVICDGGYVSGQERILSRNGISGVTFIDTGSLINSPNFQGDIILKATKSTLSVVNKNSADRFAKPDYLSILETQSLVRQLAKYRNATAAQLVELTENSAGLAEKGLLSLLQVGEAAQIDPQTVWRKRSARERLRVPIGWDTNGKPMEIDIKEAAENGMGPHGLCIGATGSGKSEFLRTLVLAMLLTHSPDALNLVLVDFKGGATFLGLDAAPHVSAVITNLEDELDLVDRMQDALYGEMNRRQEILRAAGNFPNVTEYEKARANGADLEPLPALFIVVDEFSELLSQKPDFADLFVAIGRLGRSLHMHLLLASQRLEEGKLRGLDSHLSYRIGLKTFSANESRAVLGVPDAYHLPSDPGSGYLKSDTADLVKFKAAYVSGPYKPERMANNNELFSNKLIESPVSFFTVGEVTKRDLTRSEVAAIQEDLLAKETQEITAIGEPQKGKTLTLLDVVVARLAGHGRKAHEVWLPPLEVSPALNSLLAAEQVAPSVSNPVVLDVPLGIVDKPYEQRRDSLIVSLKGAQGNVAIVGGPQSGKSNTVRTLLTSLALLNTPEQVQFYCLDFGGGMLNSLAELPHVGMVANRLNVDKIRRTVAEMITLLRQREERFQSLGIENMSEFRKLKQTAAQEGDADKYVELAEDKFGDVFLVIDGWSVIRNEFEILEANINKLISQGLSYGIHVIITAARWAEVRPAVKDLLGTRIELRLGDPTESELGRRVASTIPIGKPGRGMTADGLHMLIGLPRIDSQRTVEDLSSAVAQMVETVKACYPGRVAPAVRMLPERISRETVAAMVTAPQAGKVPLGLNEAELTPSFLDFTTQTNFLIFGDNESGKTTVLRNIAQGIIENSTPKLSKILMVDYRRTSLGAVAEDFLLGYAPSAEALTAMVNQLYSILQERIPSAEVTQQQLRERSWWSGPEIYILVDDYDLVATSNGNPLAALLDLLPQAKDIGLHLVIARRFGGLSRAFYEPILSRLKDLSVDGLIMSGNKDEGNILGNVKGMPLPPGRGNYVTRNQVELIQTSYLPPVE